MTANNEPHPRIHDEHSKEMPHIAMGAVAIGAVVMAGLLLVYMSRHAHEHPGAVLAVLVGTPVLFALVYFVARRLRRHT